jgi:hypothetical protein
MASWIVVEKRNETNQRKPLAKSLSMMRSSRLGLSAAVSAAAPGGFSREAEQRFVL